MWCIEGDNDDTQKRDSANTCKWTSVPYALQSNAISNHLQYYVRTTFG